MPRQFSLCLQLNTPRYDDVSHHNGIIYSTPANTTVEVIRMPKQNTREDQRRHGDRTPPARREATPHQPKAKDKTADSK